MLSDWQSLWFMNSIGKKPFFTRSRSLSWYFNQTAVVHQNMTLRRRSPFVLVWFNLVSIGIDLCDCCRRRRFFASCTCPLVLNSHYNTIMLRKIVTSRHNPSRKRRTSPNAMNHQSSHSIQSHKTLKSIFVIFFASDDTRMTQKTVYILRWHIITWKLFLIRVISKEILAAHEKTCGL